MVTRKAASKSTPYAAASVITAHRQSASLVGKRLVEVGSRTHSGLALHKLHEVTDVTDEAQGDLLGRPAPAVLSRLPLCVPSAHHCGTLAHQREVHSVTVAGTPGRPGRRHGAPSSGHGRTGPVTQGQERSLGGAAGRRDPP